VAHIQYELPEDLHRRAKAVAAQRGTTLKALVIEGLWRVTEEYEAEDERRRSRR
jgi:hypothetical protein